VPRNKQQRGETEFISVISDRTLSNGFNLEPSLRDYHQLVTQLRSLQRRARAHPEEAGICRGNAPRNGLNSIAQQPVHPRRLGGESSVADNRPARSLAPATGGGTRGGRLQTEQTRRERERSERARERERERERERKRAAQRGKAAPVLRPISNLRQ